MHASLRRPNSCSSRHALRPSWSELCYYSSCCLCPASFASRLFAMKQKHANGTSYYQLNRVVRPAQCIAYTLAPNQCVCLRYQLATWQDCMLTGASKSGLQESQAAQAAAPAAPAHRVPWAGCRVCHSDPWLEPILPICDLISNWLPQPWQTFLLDGGHPTGTLPIWRHHFCHQCQTCCHHLNPKSPGCSNRNGFSSLDPFMFTAHTAMQLTGIGSVYAH